MTVKATIEAVTRAATPVAGATVQVNTPTAMPPVAAISWPRPDTAERRTTTAKSGPGNIAPRATTLANASSCGIDDK
jgi:hypothetical protein